jgi:O-antigen biosynthesis protein
LSDFKRPNKILKETVFSFQDAILRRLPTLLRMPARWIGHGKPPFRMTSSVVQQAGGLRNITKKAIGLYRCEGLDGIKRGLLTIRSLGRRRNDYERWIRLYDTLGAGERAVLGEAVARLAVKPLISVVMPVYNPPPAWLDAAIESVRRQIYPHWQLCIADDASTDAAIRPLLERHAAEDGRIAVVFRERNGHISAASNSALALARGEWVALLDHDDLLAEHALFWVADAIARHPEARLIYSDEDKIDGKGRRGDPYFKCDWNIDLFYSHNLVSHLGVYHAALLRAIGGFREGFEGSQDYDLALRCVERIAPAQIHHIARVLYHWRSHAESTAQDAEAKPYAMLAGERALNEHLERRGVAARIAFIGHGYRIRYALPEPPPRISLIVPTRNGMPLLRQCVLSILEKTSYPNYEIVIVDNGSDDAATLAFLAEIAAAARVRVVRDDRPFNFSALNNAAARHAEGAVIGLINDDIEVIAPEWLSEMASFALQPGIGAVGARLWYPNDTLQHGGVILGLGGVAGHSHKHLPRHRSGYFYRATLIQSLSAVTAACLVIRKSVYMELGGLNETDLPVAFNDVDFCLRVREAGYRNVWTPYAELYHHESASRGGENTPAKQERFAREVAYMKKRWGDILMTDPAYSPNLTLYREDFSFAWPPRIASLPLPFANAPDSPASHRRPAIAERDEPSPNAARRRPSCSARR